MYTNELGDCIWLTAKRRFKLLCVDFKAWSWAFPCSYRFIFNHRRGFAGHPQLSEMEFADQIPGIMNGQWRGKWGVQKDGAFPENSRNFSTDIWWPWRCGHGDITGAAKKAFRQRHRTTHNSFRGVQGCQRICTRGPRPEVRDLSPEYAARDIWQMEMFVWQYSQYVSVVSRSMVSCFNFEFFLPMVKVPPVCDDDTVEAPPLLWASLVSLADWPSGSVTGNWGSVSYPKSASVRSASTSGSRLKIVIPRQSARKLHIVKAKAWLIACTKKNHDTIIRHYFYHWIM